MIFSKKRQSRIWIVSFVYKYLMGRSNLFTEKIKTDLTIDSIVKTNIYDELIFAFPKGDMQHFISIYNHLVDNINAYNKIIKNNDYFKSNVVVTSIALSFYAEQTLGIKHDILCTEYKHIMMDYTQSYMSKAFEILDTVRCKQNTNIDDNNKKSYDFV